jgi:hypothetical protein
MAKKAKAAKKRTGRKPAKKRASGRTRATVGEKPLPTALRKKALKKLSTIATGASHASEDTGPVLGLGYTVPLTEHRVSRIKKKTPRGKKKASRGKKKG